LPLHSLSSTLPAPTALSPPSLHDALPIFSGQTVGAEAQGDRPAIDALHAVPPLILHRAPPCPRRPASRPSAARASRARARSTGGDDVPSGYKALLRARCGAGSFAHRHAR